MKTFFTILSELIIACGYISIAVGIAAGLIIITFYYPFLVMVAALGAWVGAEITKK